MWRRSLNQEAGRKSNYRSERKREAKERKQ